MMVNSVCASFARSTFCASAQTDKPRCIWCVYGLKIRGSWQLNKKFLARSCENQIKSSTHEAWLHSICPSYDPFHLYLLIKYWMIWNWVRHEVCSVWIHLKNIYSLSAGKRAYKRIKNLAQLQLIYCILEQINEMNISCCFRSRLHVSLPSRDVVTTAGDG